MKTKTVSNHLAIDEGFNKFKESKQAQMKSAAKNKKQNEMNVQIEKMWSQLSQKDKSKWAAKNSPSNEKNTPQKKKITKLKANKMIPVTSATGKKKSLSDQNQQLQAEKQVRIQRMDEVAKNLFTGKSKKIKKQSKKNNKAQQYQIFYKFNFKKLKQEHPNWQAEKITHIISLLWKKRKMDAKYQSEREVQQVYEKIINGKEAFKEFKIKSGVNERQVDRLWSKLPVESKRKWQLECNGIALQKTSNKKGKMNLHKSDQQVKENQFSFLKKMM